MNSEKPSIDYLRGYSDGCISELATDPNSKDARWICLACAVALRALERAENEEAAHDLPS
jgi:hypothetical protein